MAASNTVRITGGMWRSRRIRFPPVSGLRPSPDRVRETLFNWLGQDLAGKTCLDLFAGSGILSFECLSRQCAWVVMVDKEPRVVRALRENARALKTRNVEIRQDDFRAFLRTERRAYDLILLDPPFHRDILTGLLPRLGKYLKPAGLVYAESEHTLEPGSGWVLCKHASAGIVHSHLLRPDHD
jgi:16S rRNA (guanine966-N2)-methyltransferase